MASDKGLGADTAAVLAAILARPVPPYYGGKFRAACALCGKPILPGEGYRTPPGMGKVHGACAQKAEGK